MKKIYTFLGGSLFVTATFAQVTQLTSNMAIQGGISDNNRVFFASGTGAAGSTDGTVGGTIALGQFVSNPKAAFFNGSLFFNGWSPANGIELWKSDGTIAGTMMVKDINVGVSSSDPGSNTSDNGNMQVVGNTLFFTATTAAEGHELWKSDGTTGGTVLVKDLVAGPGSPSIRFTRPNGNNWLGNSLFFVVDNGGGSLALWKSDGTDGGTMMLKNFTAAGSAFGYEFVAIGSSLFFQANDGTNGAELWKTDGTVAGTTMLKDMNPGAGHSFNVDNHFDYQVMGGKLYFTTTSANGNLWVSDGTSAGTQLVFNFNNAHLRHSVILNNKIYFAAEPSSGSNAGTELWESDGTSAGTMMLKDINPGANHSDPGILLPPKPATTSDAYDQFILPGNKFIFFADDGVHGRELWVSDGTTAGTGLLKDVNPGVGSSYIGVDSTYSGIFFTGTAAYLDLNDGTNGYELWKSDGTVAGTTMVADINPGSAGSNPNFLGMVNRSILIFQARSTAGTLELFRLNGLVTAFPVKLTEFTAAKLDGKVLLQWVTADETNTSHFNIQRSANAWDFETIGKIDAIGGIGVPESYYFADELYNRNLKRFFYRLEIVDKDGSKTYSEVRAVEQDNQKSSFVILPNPVHDDATIQLVNISGDIELKVVNMAGQVLVKYSRNIQPGNLLSIATGALTSGVYIISIEYNGVVLSRQMIKQ